MSPTTAAMIIVFRKEIYDQREYTVYVPWYFSSTDIMKNVRTTPTITSVTGTANLHLIYVNFTTEPINLPH
jgi:hypothetical protein